MRFRAVEAVVPGRCLSNEDVVSQVVAINKECVPRRTLELIAHALDSLFAQAGTRLRYIRADGETAGDLIARAGEAALKSAGLEPGDIDLLIYVGVGRGYIEPAMANAFQDKLGLSNATCFDILDACASWLRALHVARAFFQSGFYKRIMILNGEFNAREYADFQCRTVSDLRHKFAQFTVGEAATATILEASDDDVDYYASFKTYGHLRSLCMIPLASAAEFNIDPLPAFAEPLHFFSQSRELFEEGIARMVAHYDEDSNVNSYQSDIAFGHAASDTACARVAEACGGRLALLYRIHARFGNTVSATIPMAIHHAIRDGKLKHLDRVVIGMASAGLSTAWARFKFVTG
jgi:3-oxoacyl-[acyl-carrier-protein] synthase III